MNISLTDKSRALRRTVGTTAWAVLEDLLIDARCDANGRLVAATNVRRLAEQVGVSKDTAARAIARLVSRGVVARVASARSERGMFASTVYVVDLAPLAGITIDDNTMTQPPSPNEHARRAKPSRVAVPHLQATLFDDPVADAS